MPLVLPPALRDMRVRFAIQAPSATQDASGNATTAWTDVINPIWGSLVDYVRPAFLTFMTQVLPSQLYDIGVRYRPGVVKGMRVVELATGRAFVIMDINNLNHHNEWLILRCTEFA